MRPTLRRIVCIALLAGVVLVLVWNRSQVARFTNYLAQSALSSDEIDDACRWLNVGEAIAGQQSQSQLLRARVSRKLEDFAAAQQSLEQAAALGAPNEMLEQERTLLQAQSGKVRDVLPRLVPMLVVSSHREKPEIYEAFVRGLVKTRVQVRTAIDLCNAWVSEYPSDPRPHIVLSELAHELMDLDVAVVELRKALTADSANGPAALALGQVLLERHELEEASELFQIAGEDKRTRLPALAMQACSLRLLGQPAAARSLLEKTVLAEDPKSEIGNLEWARLELDAGRYESAVSRFKELLASNPKNHDARQELVSALQAAGQHQEAATQQQQVREARTALVRARFLVRKLPFDPANANVRSEIGRIYVEYGDAELGKTWLRSALYFDPMHQESLQVLQDGAA